MKFSYHIVVQILAALLTTQYAYAQPSYAERYAASTDLSEFVDQRASDPKQGSFFYSYWARWECLDDGGVARRIAQGPPLISGSAQSEAVRIQLQRCRNLPREKSLGTLQLEDVALGRAAGDKLFAQFKGDGLSWFSLSDQQELQRAFSLLTPDNDPNIVWVVAQRLAGSTYKIAVHGMELSDQQASDLRNGIQLAACDLNVDCGKSHRWLRVWCVQNGECDYSTLESYWRRSGAKTR